MENIAKGNDILALVNKRRCLPRSHKSNDLQKIDKRIPSFKKGLMLRAGAAINLKQMSLAAKKDKITLITSSAYRSWHVQKKTFQYWMEKIGKEEAGKRSARPGHSQHQLGTAIDFTSMEILLGFSKGFEQTREFKWLKKNSHKFGFVLSYPKGKEKITGYIFEPWHYRFIGVENAKKMIKSKLILEDFLKIHGRK